MSNDLLIVVVSAITSLVAAGASQVLGYVLRRRKEESETRKDDADAAKSVADASVALYEKLVAELARVSTALENERAVRAECERQFAAIIAAHDERIAALRIELSGVEKNIAESKQ